MMVPINVFPAPRREVLFLFIIGASLLLLLACAVYLIQDGDDAPVTVAKVQAVRDSIPVLYEDADALGMREFRGEIARNMPFAGALLAAGIDRAVADTVQRQLEAVGFNFQRCMPGQQFVAQVDSNGALARFRYEVDRLRSYWVCRNSAGVLEARQWEIPVQSELVVVEGEVRSSVYHTIMSMGEKPQLVADYAEVLGYDIDFIFDPRVGDRFGILVEKKLLDGDIVGYGRIVAASYVGEITGDVRGYWYDADSTVQGWFAPDGENLQKAFMRSPLSILRVTSGFGMRMHPISGRRKMHTGIDYAAPTGTPVWAVGSGTVQFAGWKGGYGKTIEIRHAGGVVTRYGHLSRIGVSRGQAVRQHQTIGAVGSTGFSTGPHLHFEYLVGGQFIPPRKLKNPPLKRLPQSSMDAFTAHMRTVDSLWSATPRVEGRRRIAIAQAASDGARKSRS